MKEQVSPAMLPRRFIFIATALLALGIASAHAITVNTTADSGDGSLRQAIAATASGGSIDFNIPTTDGRYDPISGIFTIVLTGGELAINRDVTITGPRNAKISVAGAGSSRVFNIVAGNVTISNLSIVNGRAFGANGANQVTNPPQPAQPGGAGQGGGILNAGSLTLRNCMLSANQARGGNGGSGSDLGSFTDGAPAGHGSGGAIANFGTVTLINCTLSGNSAVGGQGGGGRPQGSVGAGAAGGNADGGAIWNGGTLVSVNSTVFGNSATAGNGGNGTGPSNGGAGGSATGGGLRQSGPSATPQNTIVAGNTVARGNGGTFTPGTGAVAGANGTATGPDIFGNVASQGHNLIGRTDGNAGWNGTDLLGGMDDATRLDPLLGPLQDNGGPTFTHRPSSDSAAVNTGDDAVLGPPHSLTTDARGYIRKAGTHVDIGAVERGLAQVGSSLTVTNTGSHNDGCTTDDCTLVEAITAANANGDASTINFAPNVTGTIYVGVVGGYSVTAPLTIKGPGARRVAVRGDYVVARRCFNIAAGVAVSISDLTLTHGSAPNGEDGGAIYNLGQLTLVNCAVTNSSTQVIVGSGGNGGGLYNGSGASASLFGCTFTGNVGAQFGGGAVFNVGTLSATNCTFHLNSAPRGGGILSVSNNGASLVTLRNCTISNNTATSAASASDGGGGYYGEGGAGNTLHRFSNTILAGNSNSMNPDLRGHGTSEGNNLVGNLGAIGSGFSNGTNDKVGVAPNFGSFGNHGGPTDTISLLANSPAINMGNDMLAPPRDQRHYSRSGTSDIGAFEFNGVAPAAIPLVSVVSRKTHTNLGAVDLNLPTSGSLGVESRTGGATGNHTVVFTFANALTSVASSGVTGGGGNVSSSGIGSDPREYVVNLTDVANAQTLTLTLVSLTDTFGNETPSVSANMGVLFGDSNADGVVNSGDATQTKNRSGQPTSATNFRSDFNLDGTINSGDATVVRSRSGQFIP